MRSIFLPLIVLALWTATTPREALAQSYKWAPHGVSQEAARAAAPAFGATGYTPSIPTSQIPLPVPVDPNDLLMQDAFDRSDFGSGYAVAAADATDDPLAVFRLLPNVNLNAIYDTGVPGADHSPSSLALQGSAAARGSGVFSMNDTRASLKTDVQLPSISSQAYMELKADESGGLQFRQIFGRVGNWLGGSYYSSFVDNGALPQSIIANSAPAGAFAAPGIAQLQYAKLFDSGLLVGAAIENPITGDYTPVAATDTQLPRIPDFVARLRYQPFDAWGSLQGAISLREFGYEDMAGVEHFTSTAVSYSTHLRLKTAGDNNVRLGFTGGKGAGSRIFGLNAAQVAAGPLNGNLVPLQNLGAFASYQHFWADGLWTNAAYGYAFADTTSDPAMALATRRAQNGWVNLIWMNPSGNVSLGAEYQFAQQEVSNGMHGLNHALQFTLQIGKGYATPGASSPAAAAAMSPAAAPGAAVTPGDIGVYPRL